MRGGENGFQICTINHAKVDFFGFTLTSFQFTCMYVCMYVCMFECIYEYICMFLCIYVYVCMYVCMYVPCFIEQGGEERLDATVTFDESGCEKVVVISYTSEEYDRDKFFSALTPAEGEGCYIPDADSMGADDAVCWWYLSCGRVLGKHHGMLLEYDSSTLAPLGLVVGKVVTLFHLCQTL